MIPRKQTYIDHGMDAVLSNMSRSHLGPDLDRYLTLKLMVAIFKSGSESLMYKTLVGIRERTWS